LQSGGGARARVLAADWVLVAAAIVHLSYGCFGSLVIFRLFGGTEGAM
jgi:hypothetical protein